MILEQKQVAHSFKLWTERVYMYFTLFQYVVSIFSRKKENGGYENE